MGAFEAGSMRNDHGSPAPGLDLKLIGDFLTLYYMLSRYEFSHPIILTIRQNYMYMCFSNELL